jgi:hypothetical protein
MAKSKNNKPKPRLTDWHFKPDEELSEKAGYPVKNHGHRHYRLRLKIDPDTGEIYLPVGYKWVSFIDIDRTTLGTVDMYAFVLVKDEIHG